MTIAIAVFVVVFGLFVVLCLLSLDIGNPA